MQADYSPDTCRKGPLEPENTVAGPLPSPMQAQDRCLCGAECTAWDGRRGAMESRLPEGKGPARSSTPRRSASPQPSGRAIDRRSRHLPPRQGVCSPLHPPPCRLADPRRPVQRHRSQPQERRHHCSLRHRRCTSTQVLAEGNPVSVWGCKDNPGTVTPPFAPLRPFWGDAGKVPTEPQGLNLAGWLTPSYAFHSLARLKSPDLSSERLCLHPPMSYGK